MAHIPRKNTWRKVKELREVKKKIIIEKKLEKELARKGDAEDSNANDVDFSCIKEMKTVSIAIAGSVLSNAQSPELKTYLAGQIARAACIFKIDEVVIFNDMGDTPEEGMTFNKELHKAWKSCLKLAKILQYLECPQYLRKYIFPMSKELQYAGLLNPLEAPHHLKISDLDFPFREGVITGKETKTENTSYANIGLHREALVDKALDPGIRVTVQLLPKEVGKKKVKGIIVPPSMPKAKLGIYWGYEVRLAKTLSRVMSECPYEGGYDLLIGTSDKGKSINNVQFKDFHHCIIFFGGLNGLEMALENDESIQEEDITELLHYYINTCPNQGSRTIRTEEAILISLTILREKLQT